MTTHFQRLLADARTIADGQTKLYCENILQSAYLRTENALPKIDQHKYPTDWDNLFERVLKQGLHQYKYDKHIINWFKFRQLY